MIGCDCKSNDTLGFSFLIIKQFDLNQTLDDGILAITLYNRVWW